MGAYLDSLVSARRQRLARMNANPARGQPEHDGLVGDPKSAARGSPLDEALAAGDDIASILAQLKVLERRLAVLVDALPEDDGHDHELVPTGPDDPPRPRVSDIKRAICREHGLTILDLEGASHFPAIVRARQIAMYLARKLSAKSFPEIGRFFGRRDHTTALHAYNKIKRLRSTDANLDRDLVALEARILAMAAPEHAPMAGTSAPPTSDCQHPATDE